MVIVLDEKRDEGYSCTCRNFDAATRRCKIYDDRPKMCSEHGVKSPCTAPGCTLT